MNISYKIVLLRKRQGFADGKDLITIIQQKDRVLKLLQTACTPRSAQRKGAGHRRSTPTVLQPPPAQPGTSGEPRIEQ